MYKMPDYNVINQKDGKVFFPYSIPVKEPISEIFPVPVENAIGTIDFNNAIISSNSMVIQSPIMILSPEIFSVKLQGTLILDIVLYFPMKLLPTPKPGGQ
jgi:hypothetical protein